MMESRNRLNNRINRSLQVLFVVLGMVVFVGIAGCTSPAGTGAATVKTPENAVSIGDIIKNPAAFNGTTVVVQGKITNECGSGCWFMVNDGTGTLYIDLAPHNFAIPQLQGSPVIIEGTIVIANGDPTLNAIKVVTDSRTYP
jgi:uncharacterized protein YdeI (BOF family)